MFTHAHIKVKPTHSPHVINGKANLQIDVDGRSLDSRHRLSDRPLLKRKSHFQTINALKIRGCTRPPCNERFVQPLHCLDFSPPM